jgi:F0F1-type ATP synthase membrane subunit c/vacuolar-type H+-ATPase subunit K
MNRNPQIKGKIMTFMVLFVALVEVTAIYGLIIAFKIIGEGAALDPMYALGAGLAIGLA